MVLEATKAAIIRYCQYQERCQSEVRNKLFELGAYTTDADECIADLIEMGLINEERFARAYARGKFRMKQWGREKIKQQLKLRKISDYCIKKGLTEIDGEEYERITQKLIEKKAKELKSEKNIHIFNCKIFKYMIQKGYERDIIIDMLKEGVRTKKTD